MAPRKYDAIIVGGRCAGAALANFLARDGASVLVLEAGKLGTDQVLSRHTIYPAGMDLLDELGVGEPVRQGSPPAQAIRFQVEDGYADIKPPAGRSECCPRRYRLDRLLQDAAINAGSEFCESTLVTGLLRDDDRVIGVRAEHDGDPIEAKAPVTVGADGRHSSVAKLVHAEEYLGYDWARGMYWAYWEPPPVWKSAAFPYDSLIRFSGKDRRVIFSTDDAQILMATLPLVEEARRWKSNPAEGYKNDLASDPDLRLLVREGKMMSKVIGTLAERFFFRCSAGPGWALVGDAGHHKDPVLGWGISEALVQAKQLASAIREGGDAALIRYWRRRDVDALPRFRMGEERGSPHPINKLFPLVLRKISRTPDQAQQLFRETEYDVNP